MSKEEVIANWKRRSVREVELPSGAKVGLRLTSIRDEIIAGSFSGLVLDIAKKVESQAMDTDKVYSEDELRDFSEFRNTLIARCVASIEGEAVELDVEDVASIPSDDQDDIWLYVSRVKRLPKAETT